MQQGKQGTSNFGKSDAKSARAPAVVDPRLLRALLSVPRVLRLYPTGHQRVEAQLAQLEQALALRFGDECQPLHFVVRGGQLELNGEEPSCSPELAGELAFKLRRRRIRMLTLRPGVQRRELERVAEMIALDHKELLRAGGPVQYLSPDGDDATAHVEVRLFQGAGGDGDGDGLSRIAAVVAQTLASDETLSRLERIRAAIADQTRDDAIAVEAQAEFEDVLHDFLARPEWEGLSEPEAKRALLGFLDLLEHTLAGRPGDGYRARIDSLKSFFRSLDPDDLARGSDRGAAGAGDGDGDGDDDLSESNAVSYDAEGVDEFLGDVANAGDSVRSVRREMDEHCHEENALLILCELMVAASNQAKYQERRDMFLGAISGRAWSSRSLARVLRFMVIEMKPVGFETNDSLVQAVFTTTDDEEALVLFLASMSSRQDLARPILAQLAKRPDPFPLLVRLLRAPLLESFRPALTDRLLETAIARQEALNRWALKNRSAFFRPEVFAPLFRRGTELVGPIAKEILARGPSRDRVELISRLRRDGSSKALRILVIGMPFGGGNCDRELLRALGSFDHPLAVGALREVVHRSNTGELRSAEASAALHSLSRMTRKESLDFIHEVAGARRLGIPLYRDGLRRLAANILVEFEG